MQQQESKQLVRLQQWLTAGQVLSRLAIPVAKIIKEQTTLDPRNPCSGLRRIKMREPRPGSILINNGCESPVSQELQAV